ncbi:hypothetical protein WI74_32015 [Burkholderia ubonensis]|nr:hypothetical protein WI74_32015 [Burkholderia ubonensis]
MRASSSRGRRALTKSQLLPLPADQIRHLSLKHHLALAVLRAGRGDLQTITTLMHVLYLAFFLRDAGAADSASYQCAEAALDACVTRAEHGEPWSLSASEHAAIAQIVVAHDMQLSSTPVYRYLDAWERVQHASVPGGCSPISKAG